MKTAGEVLSALFDERFLEKAQGYSKLHKSWKDITEKNKIAAAADYSRVKELDKGIIYIEADHPGWKQILQTKESKLLYDFRFRFPDLDISGISIMLGSGKPKEEVKIEETTPVLQPPVLQNENTERTPQTRGYDSIKDEDFKESLRKLKQTIEDSSH